ncbi:hypothetical protein NUSPORA_01932 [Nucleospora cyclopteri]
MGKAIQLPFYHKIVDNFLKDENFNQVMEIYKKMHFKELKTDLFNFLQTNEVCDQLKFFTNELDKIISVPDKKHLFYTVFCSYYRKNDFLLCHDDCIDGREFAFTYYLDDFNNGQTEGGELILYENDCVTINKKIEVKKNRLVLFKVSSESFHEVRKCNKEGRKAITGWLNSKNNTFVQKNFYTPLNLPKNLFEVEFPVKIVGKNEFLNMDLSSLEEIEGKKSIMGPFVNRRVYKIELEEFILCKIDGLKLISAEFLLMDQNSYILCNDKINMIEEEVYDAFIFKNDCKEFINYVNDSGKIEFKLDAVKSNFIIGKRGKLNLFIPSPPSEIKFYHFIYKSN